jgi:hypothetical protein
MTSRNRSMIADIKVEAWLARLRAELAAIHDVNRVVSSMISLAEIELACGSADMARTSLTRALGQFDHVHPGSWTSLVYRAAELCGRLGENRLLEPEMQRGLAWLADPEFAKWQGGLRDQVREISLQAGRAEAAAELVSEAWLGKRANALVDQCICAGWRRAIPELRRALPLARRAIAAAGTGPDHLRTPLGYHLMRACTRAGLLDDAVNIAIEYDFPLQATDDLLQAIRAAKDHSLYARLREQWLTSVLGRFAREKLNHQFRSQDMRRCTEVQRRIGDTAGFLDSVRRFHDAVAAWTPACDWIACAVVCDLAVLHVRAGEVKLADYYFTEANQLAKGLRNGTQSVRGSKSLMASILSSAYHDVGETNLAVRFARKISASADRRTLLVSALIAGGRDADAEAELAKVAQPETRADLLIYSLRRMLRPERD